MLKIVCLAWKFMRLHVAISFENYFFLPLNINEILWLLLLCCKEKGVWSCNDDIKKTLFISVDFDTFPQVLFRHSVIRFQVIFKKKKKKSLSSIIS